MGIKTRFFDSSMADSPVLSGTAGALIAVLDAVLVNGFGSRTVASISVAGNVATATYSGGHPFKVDSVGQFSGITPSGLNGAKRILSVGANTVTFAAPGISDGAGSGSMSSKVAAAGWTKLYSDTNLAAYKSPAVESTGCILRIDDTGTTTARLRGYEVMTDVNTGTGPFPTTAQIADSGAWWSKSSAADSSARPWVVVADDRGFYFMPKHAGAGAEHQANYFGDVLSLKSNDPYACLLRGNVANRSGSTGVSGDDLAYSDSSAAGAGSSYMPRAPNALGGSVTASTAAVSSVGLPLAFIVGSTGWPYPASVDNGLMITPVAVHNTIGWRGYLPGLFYSPQVVNGSFSTFDKVAGSGDLVGRKVVTVRAGSLTGGNAAVLFFDHLSDWR